MVDLSSRSFEELALETFREQAAGCAVYRDFVRFLGIDPQYVHDLTSIPFLPVEFFKTHSVMADGRKPAITFSSSGTTGMTQSRHHVADVSIYESSFRKAFELFYGDIRKYTVLALLPSYQEREGSSLIYMVDDLIKRSERSASGYVLHDPARLRRTLEELKAAGEPVLLIGVTYALLDFIERYPISFPGLIVMETGGMKGRRREMIREELHDLLCAGFGVPAIHSEYGMTELLSQGYSKKGGLFECPPWMRILIRDTNDPFSYCASGQTGGINVIDLANRYSCSFLSTQDLGRSYDDWKFEVLGRFDNSDVRGCNLLVQ